MNKNLIFGTVAGLAVVGGLVLAPIAANAKTTQTQTGNSNSNYSSRNGSGNGQQAQLETRAEILNMTTEQLKEKLQTKTWLEIAEEQGLSKEQFQTKVREAAKARWEDRGLSAEEIQERAKAQEQRQADCDGDGNQYRNQGQHTEQ